MGGGLDCLFKATNITDLCRFLAEDLWLYSSAKYPNHQCYPKTLVVLDLLSITKSL